MINCWQIIDNNDNNDSGDKYWEKMQNILQCKIIIMMTMTNQLGYYNFISTCKILQDVGH